MTGKESTLTGVSQTDAETCTCTRRAVEFYCYNEDVLICKLCKFDLYSNCKTEPIYLLSDEIFQSKDYHSTIWELNSLKSAFATFKTSDTLQTLRRSHERQSVVHDTKRLKIKRDRTNLERELTAKIRDFHHDLIFERTYEKKDCEIMIGNVDFYVRLLEEYKESGQNKRAFILLFKLKKIMPLMQDILSSMFDKQRHHLINSQITGTLQRYMTSDNAGNVKLSRSHVNPERVSPRRVSRAANLYQMTNVGDVNLDFHDNMTSKSLILNKNDVIRSADAKSETTSRKQSSITRHITTASFDEKGLTGAPTRYLKLNQQGRFEKRTSTMKVTNDGRILLLDYENQRLEMYGLNKLFLYSIELRRPVWDFDFTNEQEILITCPYDGILLYVQISDEDVLFETSFMNINKGCRAICCFPNRLFVSFTGDNPCIKYLSKDGLTYRTISSIMDNVLCLLLPLHMHVSSDRSLIFVSDYGLQRVTVLTQNGDILKSHDVHPGFPLAMTSDRDGNVLVSVEGTNEILMISRDGQRSRTLLRREAVVDQPSALAYKIESKLLLVAFDKEAIVKMFHIV